MRYVDSPYHDALRHELRHWTVRLEEDWFLTRYWRGDAFGEFVGTDPTRNYEEWIRMANEYMDREVDEAACAQIGPHDYVDEVCTRCKRYVLADQPEYR